MDDISIFSWERPSEFEMAVLSLRNSARCTQKIFQMNESQHFCKYTPIVTGIDTIGHIEMSSVSGCEHYPVSLPKFNHNPLLLHNQLTSLEVANGKDHTKILVLSISMTPGGDIDV
jgi:hypothetical protein